jgi:hypothetical protein
MERPWDAVVWWEIRRIPFNLLLLAAGLASAFISAFVGSHVWGPDQDIGNPFLGAMLYAIGANLCYTLGWITELLWGWGDTERTKEVRAKIFRLGLIFSVCLTLAPAIVVSMVWATHGFK